MNEDFVPFELAVKLKEKGFREECLCHYIDKDLVYNIESPIVNNQLWFCHNKYDNIWHRDNVDAPTISQVLKWLREEKKLHIEVMFIRPLHNRVKYYITDTDGSRGDFMDVSDEYYETWEQAALAGIEYVLDNLI